MDVMTKASMTCMSMGVAYGWTSPVLPQLLSPDSIIPMSIEEGSWIPVCVEGGSLLTSLPAGIIIDKFGRKNSLMLCAPILLSSWLLIKFTRSVTMLYISKLMQGSVMGVILCVCPIYITEISKPNIRGMLSTIIITMWYIGFILAYTIGAYTSYDTNAYISLALSSIYVILLCFQPESPYYYVLKNQKKNALKSLSYFRNVNPSELSEEIKAIEDYITEEQQNKTSFLALFRDPVSLRCLFIMLVLIFTTIASGLTYTLCYAAKIFSLSSSDTFSANDYSIAISVLFLIMNLVPTILMDKIGRRVLASISSAGCAMSTLLGAVFFYLHSETGINVSSFHWVPLVAVSGYCAFLSIGLNPLANTFQGELFPANTKGVACGIVAFSFGLISSSCLKVFFLIDTYIGTWFNYTLFTLFATLGGILLHLYLPETKDKTLAQIQRELNRRYNRNAEKDRALMEPINQTVNICSSYNCPDGK